jgi:hypothetical protein
LDVGLLVGENLLVSSTPLIDGQSMSFGLVSAVPKVTKEDILVPALSIDVIRHGGSIPMKSKLSEDASGYILLPPRLMLPDLFSDSFQ